MRLQLISFFLFLLQETKAKLNGKGFHLGGNYHLTCESHFQVKQEIVCQKWLNFGIELEFDVESKCVAV